MIINNKTLVASAVMLLLAAGYVVFENAIWNWWDKLGNDTETTAELDVSGELKTGKTIQGAILLCAEANKQSPGTCPLKRVPTQMVCMANGDKFIQNLQKLKYKEILKFSHNLTNGEISLYKNSNNEIFAALSSLNKKVGNVNPGDLCFIIW